MDVMSEMFADPDLLAAMLAKGKTDREQTAIGKRIATKLAEKGFLTAIIPARRAAPGIIRESGEDVELPEGQVDPVLQRAQELLKQRENVQLQTPPAAPPTTQAAIPAPPTNSLGAGPNPQVRQTYAALFPNDPISGMIPRQGIGGLLQ